MEFEEQTVQKHMGKCRHKNRIIKGALDLEEREMVQDNYLDGWLSDRMTTHANSAAMLLKIICLIGNNLKWRNGWVERKQCPTASLWNMSCLSLTASENSTECKFYPIHEKDLLNNSDRTVLVVGINFKGENTKLQKPEYQHHKKRGINKQMNHLKKQWMDSQNTNKSLKQHCQKKQAKGSFRETSEMENIIVQI